MEIIFDYVLHNQRLFVLLFNEIGNTTGVKNQKIMKTLAEKRKELKEIGYLVETLTDEMVEKFYPNVEKSKRYTVTEKEYKKGFKQLAKLCLI